jgi:hypothetical protein
MGGARTTHMSSYVAPRTLKMPPNSRCMYAYALGLALVLNEMSKKWHVIRGMIMQGAHQPLEFHLGKCVFCLHDPGVDTISTFN